MDESYVCTPCLGTRHYNHIACRVLRVLGLHHDEYVPTIRIVYLAYDLTLGGRDVVERTVARTALRFGLDILKRSLGDSHSAFMWSTHGNLIGTSLGETWLPRGSITRLNLTEWCTPEDVGRKTMHPWEVQAEPTSLGEALRQPLRTEGSPLVQPSNVQGTNSPVLGDYQRQQPRCLQCGASISIYAT